MRFRYGRADGSGADRVAATDASGDAVLTMLAPETAYDWAEESGSRSGSFTTGALPFDLGARLTVTGTASTPYIGGNFPCGAGARAAAFDTETGELVWYADLQAEGVIDANQMVSFTEDHTALAITGDQLVEVDQSGVERLRLVAGRDYVYNLHHDVTKVDGRIYAVYSQSVDAGSVDGFVVWDDRGTELGHWFAGDHLDVPHPLSSDWLHLNSVAVRDGLAYLSSWQESTVFAVDADPDADADPSWYLSGQDGGGLGSDFALDWGGVAPDSFVHQHSLSISADGGLTLLDNEHGRALTLTLDPDAHVGTVDGAWAASLPSCGPQGTAMRTAAGGVLVDCASPELSVREFGPESSTVPSWTATLSCDAPAQVGWAGQVQRWYPLDGW
ncbi:MAG: aryl-sulfate sulfotransferase [Myxococcota bacterium]